ncbi:RAMP superfamily CRISPR-associated protein [Nonomuraea angiospora]|uniref:RAMP superfamily CRISPR-associated protein n=1 Tax=Nonomuraea angiospora TaxID=46172 RepID=UPI0034407016
MSGDGEFAISLVMLSDWHVGTGTGIQGYVDRIVQRDTDNVSGTLALPIIPAKTLVGVWRDSCEIAAHALDSGPDGVWHEWLGFLFGGQYATDDDVLRAAALTIEGPLRLSERLNRLLRDKPRLAWAATFRKPGVAIDPALGAASDRKLWFDEMARAGLTLEGRGRVEGFAELDEGQREAAILLLAAGARLLENIGGKRRRGAGRCTLSVVGPDFVPDWSPAALKNVPKPPAGPPPAIPVHISTPPQEEQGWERIELAIAVEQPILAATTVLGNVTSGERHIPGWCLMPEVVRRLGGMAHALVRTGDLVVTAATPQAPDGSRTLPAPRVLVRAKGGKEVIGNRMASSVESGKPCRDGYVVPEAAEVVNPPTTVRMHNSIDDNVQRPTREIGGIYVYRALAARTVLRAEVRVRAGTLEPGWEQRLSGRWRIGRSSKDDYGQAQVTTRTVANQSGNRGVADQLRVWLLSDLLVRDRRLRPSTDLHDVARALEQALRRAGAPDVHLKPVTRSQDDRVTVAVGAHRTESWHRGWRMPRATLYGLAAGSCLTFTVTGGPISADVLAEVRAAGIGERRSEGFGQLELDHDLLTRPITEARTSGRHADADPGQEPLLAPGEKGYDEARIFERAAWRSEILRSCDDIRGDKQRRNEIIPGRVSNSQLNALRAIVREPSSERAVARFLWLTRGKAGRPDWPSEAVSTLRSLLADPDTVWRLLSLPENHLVVTSDGVQVLRGDLRAEAVRVLIDSCLAAHGRAEAASDLEGSKR